MRNCLITQLKGTVLNDNLPIMGKFRISFNNVDNLSVGLFVRNNTPIKLSDVVCSGTLAVTQNDLNYFIFTGTGTAIISNKYTITNIHAYGGTFDYSEIDYVPLDTLFFSEDTVVNNLNSWSDINKWNNITYLRLENKTISGESINLPNLGTLMLKSIKGGLHISSLGLLQNLTTLLIKGGNLYGTFEDFIRARRTWQPTGSIASRFNIINTGTTFNGEFIAGDITMSWTENTMTVNGITIDA